MDHGPGTRDQGPVSCLGMTFPNDEERRKHFLGLLAEKLKDPEFRKIEGFPIGSDEDLLALSDPPYYTACPNPFIADFIKHYGTPYDPSMPYNCEPFAADVSEGKSDPVYTAHSYHTKVPHQAIMRFLLHYTSPGDIVLDGFCGTGMTGVAAQMCANPPAELRATLQAEMPSAQWGARLPLLFDLSPFATFIAHNYNVPINVSAFELELKRCIEEVATDLQWAYSFSDGQAKSDEISLTVWSDVFICPNCSRDIVFWGNGVKRVIGEIDPVPCPHCGSKNSKGRLEHRMTTFFDPLLQRTISQPRQVPVFVLHNRGHEREANGRDSDVVAKCLKQAAELHPPIAKMMFKDEPWGDVYRAGYHSGVTHVHHFYNPRQLLALASLWNRFGSSDNSRRMRLVLTSFISRNGFRGNRFVINKHNPNGRINGPLTNCLYFPSLFAEQNMIELARSKGRAIIRAFSAIAQFQGRYCLSTESATGIDRLPDASVDYIFVDPPFGANIMYSEMNFLTESWLGCVTNNCSEAVVNDTQHKDESTYRSLLTSCLKQFYRVLKPGRWLTMEFHNSKSSIWNAIQTSLGDAGFVIADVHTLDKQKGTVYQEYYISGATKQDLIISCYKPNGGLEDRFKLEAGTAKGVWDFVRTHLKQLPRFVSKDGQAEVLAERQNYLLFDRLVAFHVQRGVTLPLSAAEFYAGLVQRFSERDGMYFLPEQVAEYDQKRMTVQDIALPEFAPVDELSAIRWLQNLLKAKPQTFQDIHPQFLRGIGGWQKHEKPLELSELLEQNFLCYDGRGLVPEQIHAYLSSNWKELRNLPKEDESLRAKGKDRWYVPDPNKAGDLEKLRERSLLREFEDYRAVGASGRSPKLKVFRLEAVRAGFKKAWQERDYATIITVARKIPENVLQEDPKLLMWYDQAVTRSGGDS
ncbi:MAG: DNA methylase [Deltaproteobacteria bacterium RIFOXYA12_FULL_61_11]|nr:MAG: DNA methylase [Deltaproteobacteria bacterium RIFOXYA12_FULL_61_11]